MRLVLLGVRGSTPATGAEFVRFGGHTSCVAVIPEGSSVPTLLLDAGTGLRSLPGVMRGEAFRGSLVLTHLHWDHVQGLPFSPSVDNSDADVRMFVPGAGVDGLPSARDTLARGMSPPHFPIGPEGLKGSWQFLPALPGVLPIPACAVRVAAIPHKGGSTVGVRVEIDGASAAYLPDHALTDQTDASDHDSGATALADGVDVLLHGGQFAHAEASTAREYGHATIEAAMAIADRCNVGRLVLTHHSPTRTDGELDGFAATYTRTPGGRAVSFARQDDVLAV